MLKIDFEFSIIISQFIDIQEYKSQDNDCSSSELNQPQAVLDPSCKHHDPDFNMTMAPGPVHSYLLMHGTMNRHVHHGVTDSHVIDQAKVIQSVTCD